MCFKIFVHLSFVENTEQKNIQSPFKTVSCKFNNMSNVRHFYYRGHSAQCQNLENNLNFKN